MRKVLFASLLLTFTLALAACGGDNNLNKANGDWVCDTKATLALHPDLQQQMDGATELAEGLLGAFTLSIDSANKKMSVAMGQISESGEFTVVSDSGKSLVLEMADDKLHLDFTTDDSITVYSDKDVQSKLVFTRKKK